MEAIASYCYFPTSIFGKTAAEFVILIVLYCTCLVFYRLTLSPLAGFPGLKIAAVTGWYQFYHNNFRYGTYVFRVEEMHKKYGPIIRVNPYELSINDGSFYDELYVIENKRRTDGFSHFGNGINLDDSHVLTVSHDFHRQRRKPLEPFFSRSGIRRLEPMLAELVSKLVYRLDALKGTGSIVHLDHAFSALTSDVMGRLCCGGAKGDLLDESEIPFEFTPHSLDMYLGFVRSINLLTGLPLLTWILSLIPEPVLSLLGPDITSLKKIQKCCTIPPALLAREHIEDAKRSKIKAAKHVGSKEGLDANVSLFRYVFNDTKIPESELSVDRLASEAQALLSAGTITTTRTLNVCAYYILSNDRIRSRLKQELNCIMAGYPDMPRLKELEKLPYLQAIINETLRIDGTLNRLPRCSPDEPLQYKQWTIPRNVAVGMSAYMMQTDSTIYEKPFDFIPKRWLGTVNSLMIRNLVPFARGSRDCLGKKWLYSKRYLALAEITIVLAVLFRPEGPKLELFETDKSDVTPAHDYIASIPKLDTKGVRVYID